MRVIFSLILILAILGAVASIVKLIVATFNLILGVVLLVWLLSAIMR